MNDSDSLHLLCPVKSSRCEEEFRKKKDLLEQKEFAFAYSTSFLLKLCHALK